MLGKLLVFICYLIPVVALSTANYYYNDNYNIALGISAISISIGSLLLYEIFLKLNDAQKKVSQLTTEVHDVTKAGHRFVVDMIVELRRPLHGIIGTKHLFDKDELTEEQREYYEIIDFCSSYMMKQLERIQFYSEAESEQAVFEKSPLLLKEVVTSIITECSEHVGDKDLVIEYHIEKNVPVAMVIQEDALKSILSELVGNAVKYTYKGRVDLYISMDEKNDDLLKFRIKDSGPGISEKQKSEIFSAFNSKDSNIPWNKRGSGLGLSIANTIVRLMGGELHLESVKHEGSVFWFTFPIIPTDVAATSTKPVHEAFVPAALNDSRFSLEENGARIMIVDDEPFARTVIANMLNRMGYLTDEMGNGEEAVEKANLKDYELIFMDIQMPVMDGWEASAEIINNCTNHIPTVVALTSHTRPGDKKLCEQSGMKGFISKPIKKNDLANLMKLLNIAPDFDPKKKEEGAPNETKKDSSVIDVKTYYLNFDKLYNYYDENINQCLDILQKTSVAIDELEKSMDQSLDNFNYKDFSFQAHQLKGNFSYLMCDHGQELCFKIEQESRKDPISHEAIEAVYSELKEVFTSVREEVSQICSSARKLSA